VVMQTMIQTARARFLFISHSSSSNNVTVIPAEQPHDCTAEAGHSQPPATTPPKRC